MSGQRPAPFRRLVSAIGWPARMVLLGLLALYRNWISPLSAPSCRYYPSCSSYAQTAIRVHGAGKGTLLALARLGRCHPWAAGGVDHVPERGRWRRPEPEPDCADSPSLPVPVPERAP